MFSNWYNISAGNVRGSNTVSRTQLNGTSTMGKIDPQFVASNDYHLAVSSPCIDSGANAYVQGTTDRSVSEKAKSSIPRQ